MAKIATCPEVGELHKLASGHLPPVDVEMLLGHMESCSQCLAKVQTLTPTDTLIESLGRARKQPEGQDAEIVARLIARLKLLAISPASVEPIVDETMDLHDVAAGSSISVTGEQTDVEPPIGLVDVRSFLAPAQAADEIGRLGSYRILKVLGRGGMGVVFRAEDVSLKRIVALKAMLPTLAASPSAKKRFVREAQTAASIQHDHIVTIHQVGEDRGVPFLAMEFLHGEPLDARLKRAGRLPIPEVLRIGREIAEGLAAAHDVSLIHRDIKPANVWLESRSPKAAFRVKILDFGLARTTGDQTGLTQTGAIIGTPAYMSPEQARGKHVDGRADLWSLGVILYEMATGCRPFVGADTMSILTSLAMDEPTPPNLINFNIPIGLSDLIVRLLAKAPEKRPASAHAVGEELLSLQAEVSMPIVEAMPTRRPAQIVNSTDNTQVDPWQALDESANTEIGPTAAVVTTKAKTSGKNIAVERSRRPLLLALIAGLLLFVGGGVAAYQLVFKTNDGTLIVEVDGDVDLRFKNGKLELYGEDGKLKYTLAPSEKNKTLPAGKYVVRVTGDGTDGLKLDTPEFTLEKGDKKTVRVTAGALDIANADPSAKINRADAPVRTGVALEFNGVDSFAEIASLHLPATGPVTIELWARPIAMRNKGTMFEMTAKGRMLKLHHVDLLWMGDSWNADKTALEFRQTEAATDSRWVHFAICWDGREQLFFVDGVKVTAEPRYWPCLRPEPRAARIGCSLIVSKRDDFFHGSLSEVRVSGSMRYTRDFTPQARFAADKDTIALYHCDEGQGDVLKDSSSNGHHGKIVGAKWVPADGTPSADFALAYDGAAKVEVPSLTLPRTGDLTLECYATALGKITGPYPLLVGKHAQISLFAAAEGYWSIIGWTKTGPQDPKSFWTNIRFQLNRRVHLAGVREGNTLRLYVDGKKTGEKTLDQDQLAEGVGVCVLGESGFIGELDEVRISKVVRYTADFAPRKRFETDKDTLALYHFDEGKGAELTDASGNGHHGKIVGAKWVKVAGPELPRDPDRAVANWVLKIGGTIGVNATGGYFDTGRGDKIPAGPITVKGINVGRTNGATDDDMRLIAELRGLDTVVVSYSAVTDQGIATLATLPKLDALYASGLPLTDKGVAPLKKFSHLKLHLSGTKITDVSMPMIGGFDRLDDLNLDWCSITDKGLDSLGKSHALRHLYLTRTRVTDAGVKKLAAALPKCKIVWDGGTLEPMAK